MALSRPGFVDAVSPRPRPPVRLPGRRWGGMHCAAKFPQGTPNGGERGRVQCPPSANRFGRLWTTFMRRPIARIGWRMPRPGKPLSSHTPNSFFILNPSCPLLSQLSPQTIDRLGDAVTRRLLVRFRPHCATSTHPCPGAAEAKIIFPPPRFPPRQIISRGLVFLSGAPAFPKSRAIGPPGVELSCLLRSCPAQ